MNIVYFKEIFNELCIWMAKVMAGESFFIGRGILGMLRAKS